MTRTIDSAEVEKRGIRRGCSFLLQDKEAHDYDFAPPGISGRSIATRHVIARAPRIVFIGTKMCHVL
ncbi:hypothetical protein NBRC111894_3948 [Sporolactobacillus inulinus]|uniref:Uncharacterized protein n=1 Tax=Sporolactobacillus inulinus TaxID=2078 RepID=A0A4Y1ZHL4_9BACL|nr:hypothetical protein NBRC111894_3948 [Sporolactobacillus inulinus]